MHIYMQRLLHTGALHQDSCLAQIAKSEPKLQTVARGSPRTGLYCYSLAPLDAYGSSTRRRTERASITGNCASIIRCEPRAVVAAITFGTHTVPQRRVNAKAFPSVVETQKHLGLLLGSAQGKSVVSPRATQAHRHSPWAVRAAVLTLPGGQHSLLRRLLLAQAVSGRAKRAVLPAMAPTSPLRSRLREIVPSASPFASTSQDCSPKCLLGGNVFVSSPTEP